MADSVETDLTYPRFERRWTARSVLVANGYEVRACDFARALQSELAKLPKDVQQVARISGPDDYGDDWSIVWYDGESDADYRRRYRKHLAAIAKERRKTRAELKKRADEHVAAIATVESLIARGASVEEVSAAAENVARLRRLLRVVELALEEIP